MHRHVPDGPCQQHHNLSGAKRVPHSVVHQAEAVRESRCPTEQRQRLEDAGPQAPPGQVTNRQLSSSVIIQTRAGLLVHGITSMEKVSFRWFSWRSSLHVDVHLLAVE